MHPIYKENEAIINAELNKTYSGRHRAGSVGGWSSKNNELKSGSVSLNSDTERLLMGTATEPLTGVGIFLGKDGTDYEFRAGNPAGEYIHWDGSTLTIVGSITATDGTIGGWTIGSTTLTGGGVTLDSNGTITGGTIRTSSSGQRVEITGSNDRLTFYDGNGNAEGFMYGSTVGGGTLVIDADIVLFDNNSFIQSTQLRAGAVVPTGSSDDLGASGNNWAVGYIDKLNGRTLNENVIDLSVSGAILTNQDFMPSTTGANDLGRSNIGWGAMFLDEVSAPGTPAGNIGVIFIDSSDGDLKVTFGNGTTKTIATN